MTFNLGFVLRARWGQDAVVMALLRDFRSVVALLAAVGLGVGCATPPAHPGDDWWGRDKALHFGCGAAIGAGTMLAARDRDVGDAPALGLSLAVVFGVGAAKEGYDMSVRQTGWSWRDMIWNMAGATAGSLAAWAANP